MLRRAAAPHSTKMRAVSKLGRAAHAGLGFPLRRGSAKYWLRRTTIRLESISRRRKSQSGRERDGCRGGSNPSTASATQTRWCSSLSCPSVGNAERSEPLNLIQSCQLLRFGDRTGAQSSVSSVSASRSFIAARKLGLWRACPRTRYDPYRPIATRR
jgi:hypothetical protein